MHAGHGQRFRLVDCEDAGGGVRTRHQRHVPRAGHGDIGSKAALADHEAPILADAAIGRYETEGPCAHGSRTGWFKPRMRSAASAIASTISARVGAGLSARSAWAVRIIAGVQ